ncbi:hypothetical protein BV22DRAFT_1195792 [Leucogyrophana mollusca]|uniref:Uncharacterized protein n=1 Tax=Leucogyrophana mollusca TaxID=85980 RepID=A0ACB8BH98_9AGAM|nr:hypothetical protein BV22DRAFT_1195792 [Leucogyrophana mollusca]
MMSTLAAMPLDVSRNYFDARTMQAYPRSRIPGASFELEWPAQSTSRFPISSIRPETQPPRSATPPAHSPSPIHPRYDPLHILSQPPSRTLPPHAHWNKRPAPQVAPGVLADGVLTTALPLVQNFLAAAARAPPACPPLPMDKRVLALAALSVFYRPLHPAHWVFWNKEQKRTTAAIVQAVLDTTPTPIISPIGWIAIPENLWILSSMQIAYSGALASVPWYTTYVPPETEGRMSLRKRKAPAIQSILANDKTGSDDETVDEDAPITPPPRKRARTRRGAVTSGSKASARTKVPTPMVPEGVEAIIGEAPPGTDEQAPEAVLLLSTELPVTKAAKHERIQSPPLENPNLTQDDTGQRELSVTIEVAETPQPRTSLRQKERKAKATTSPASTVSELTPARSSPLYRSVSQDAPPARGSSSSSILSEGAGGVESASGSSTAVSVYEEEGNKLPSKLVDEDEQDGEDAAEPVQKKSAARRPRAARPKAASRAAVRGSRAKSKVAEEVEVEDVNDKLPTPAQARPRTKSRAKTRRR